MDKNKYSNASFHRRAIFYQIIHTGIPYFVIGIGIFGVDGDITTGIFGPWTHFYGFSVISILSYFIKTRLNYEAHLLLRERDGVKYFAELESFVEQHGWSKAFLINWFVKEFIKRYPDEKHLVEL